MRPCLIVLVSLLAAPAPLAGEAAAPDANPALDKRPILSGAPVIVGRSRFYKWENVVTGVGGLATGFAVHPKDAGVMYVRTFLSGVFRREFNEWKWTPLCDSFTLADRGLYSVESIALDAGDPNVIYIAAGRPGETCDILKSTDRGGNWKRLKVKNAKGEPLSMSGDERGGGEQLAVDPNNGKVAYFGSCRDGLYRSTDGGENWTLVESFPQPRKEGIEIAFVVFDGRRMYGGEGSAVIYIGVVMDRNDPMRTSGVYRSKDAGDTWERMDRGPGAVARPLGGKLGPDGALYVSSPKGLWRFREEKWENIAPQENDCPAVAVDPRNAAHVLCFQNTCFLATKDGGANWREFGEETRNLNLKGLLRKPPWLVWKEGQGFGQYAADLAFDPQDGKRVWLASPYGAFSCDDMEKDSLEWAVENGGMEACGIGVAVSPPTGAPLLAGLGSARGLRFESLTEPPKTIFRTEGVRTDKGEYVESMDFCESRPDCIARVGLGFCSFSADNGLSWKTFAPDPQEETQGLIAVAPDDPLNLTWVKWGTTRAVLYTKDGGKSWNPTSGTPSGRASPDYSYRTSLALAADRAKPHTFYIYDASDGRFYRSDDGGEKWKHVATLPRQKDPGKANHVVAAAPGMPGEVWVALDDQGLFRSKDGGDSWQSVNGVARAYALAFGKGPASAKCPALYLMGQIAVAGTDQVTLFRSYDLGATWVRIANDNHAFGLATGLVGDRQVVGRAYVLTSGRGISYGVPDVKKQAEEDAKWEKENGEKPASDPE